MLRSDSYKPEKVYTVPAQKNAPVQQQPAATNNGQQMQGRTLFPASIVVFHWGNQNNRGFQAPRQNIPNNNQ